MRLTAVGVLSLLTVACSGSDDVSEIPQGDPIDCALAGAPDFTPVCLYEHDEAEQKIIVWHPDGGFRRFDVLPGGAGVASSDGAEEVIQGIMGGMLEVTIGEDRYRLPTKPVG